MSQPLISADSDQERVPPFSCSFWVVSVMLVSLTLAGCAVLDSRPPNWIEAEPARVTCDYGPDKTTERCKVALRILFRQFRADPLETHVFETWVKVDSGWYLYQKI